ncbi:type II toxin-antitoxin system death-on-curing family toxin [Anaerotruncus rubiinfantis]|uniref:type II toxin-antitoxin system death-on-curing family toxin n=1 Tax=Anaerotruncus rubiinfantis TaxID=1720200 RepID=UPI0034A21E17
MDFGSSFFRIVANIWGEKIARIGYGLAANHAFIDGNKRIGAMITQLLLQYNGYHLSLQENELADMFIAIAAGSASEKDLLNWVKERI